MSFGYPVFSDTRSNTSASTCGFPLDATAAGFTAAVATGAATAAVVGTDADAVVATGVTVAVVCAGVLEKAVEACPVSDSTKLMQWRIVG